MKNSPNWRVPPLDKQVLATLATAVLRAKLEAQQVLDDLRTDPDNVLLDDLRYYDTQVNRLEAGHAWLLELIQSEQPGR